ncbi:MAG TPA: diphthine synthase [Candidatus Thermoplasmatota archaeon]|nr:diphthine synthase [Candidatus Thermoplasmatota archaeon]
MQKRKLSFVGLGLYDEQDLSLKALQELRDCDVVFAEFYTSKPGKFDRVTFEKTIGKPITILSRHDTEQGDMVLTATEHHHVVFLTSGDPMIATTHIDLRLRAIKQGIPTRVIHGSSIATAVPGLLGLQHYKFGRTTTLAYPEKEYFPTSQYDVIRENKNMGLHTLVLLDIQAEKDRYMTANEGLDILLQMERIRKKRLITKDTVACVVARAGAPDAVVVANTIQTLQGKDFGPPLHTLVIPGRLHFMEQEALELLAGLPAGAAKKIQKL